MISKDTEKEFAENDALHGDDAKVKELPSLDDPLANERSKTIRGYIGKSPFVTWTLVAAIGIAFCLIHSHQGSLWQWTGDTAADAQSLQAKVVVSVFSAVIGGCLVAVLSKALASVSFVIFQYRGASFSYLTAVIEGYAPSRIITLVLGGRWASSVLIILILATSVVTKQMAVVSMGVEFMATNNTKISYTRNYTDCRAIMSASGLNTIRTGLTAQVFAAMLIPNSSYTSEHYDSSIPPGLAGYSQFKRLLPYAEASCVQFKSSGFFDTVVPPVTGSGAWQLKVTLPFTAGIVTGEWVNCTLKAGIANAISTCNDTKCETKRTTEDITPFAEGGNGLPSFLPFLFESYKPSGSMSNNIILTWLLGGDILRNLYAYNSDIPDKFTAKSIADRLALLGTVMTRIICDVNSRLDFADVETTPVTSNYIEQFHY
ncbi:hypothetical protein MAM1_0034d02570 [Mucor ambiguus]|uniref:Uncharacterized protein n=1 Tax=Mucor ambiguus TaxID=91626 RepID=A0A0C9M7T0_9FUNG|nr:hypothetical protein MAM1_0034d02570 [Mucor ambiguus]